MAGTLSVVVEELALGTPAQQLLDRFLLGYPRDGLWRKPAFTVTIRGGAGAERDRRVEEHGLKVADRADGQAILIVPRGPGHLPPGSAIDDVIRGARAGSRLFVHGLLGANAAEVTRRLALARERKVALLAGGSLATTFRLPDVDLPAGAAVVDALIVTVGEPGQAAWIGADGLAPLLERRRGGEAGLRAVRTVAAKEVFSDRVLPPPLLAAALSRSHSPQGNARKDARTEDLVGLGLVPKLARDPVAHVVEHRDGVKSTIFVANGVVDDVNFAVRTRGAGIVSAQLHRPRPPAAHQFSTLAAAIDDFFGGAMPWKPERAVWTAGLLDAVRTSRSSG